MPEKPTATSLVQRERSLFPKPAFLQPEMSNKGSKQINVWSKNCLEQKNEMRKKNIFQTFFLQYPCMVLSTN